MSSTPIETIECVLMECPLFTAVRRKYLIVNGCLQPLPHLFTHLKRIQEPLWLLEETRAYAKQWAIWERG